MMHLIVKQSLQLMVHLMKHFDGALVGRRWCPIMVHLMLDMIVPMMVH